MSKEYYEIGTIYGRRLLLEVEADDDGTKSIILDTIQQGKVLPEYVAVDIKKNARYFERQYPKIDLDIFQRRAQDFKPLPTTKRKEI